MRFIFTTSLTLKPRSRRYHNIVVGGPAKKKKRSSVVRGFRAREALGENARLSVVS